MSKTNDSCRFLLKNIKGYCEDLLRFEVNYNELEMTKLNYIRQRIEELWAEKCSIREKN